MTLPILDQPPASRREWIAVAAGWLVAIVVLLTWLLGRSTGTLVEELKTAQFWSLEACLFLSVVSGVLVFEGLRRKFSRRDGVRMAVLAAVAAGLTVFVAPRTNRIFYDEQIYQAVGHNLADLRRAQVCNDGGVEYGRLQCASGEYNKQPYAYPHVLSVAYRLFGVGSAAAFAVNAAAMAAIVCAVYMLVCLVFGDRDAALFSGLLLALTPQQLIWSATAAVEPSASLAGVVALVMAAHFAQSGGRRAMVAAAIATAYAIQFRPESILILPVLGLLVWPRLRGELTRPRIWWAGLLFLALVSIHIGHLFAVRNASWGTDDARFSLQYVAANLRVNGWFYLYDERFPFAFTLLAIVGLTVREGARARLSMAVYFLLFFAVDLLFYAGSYNYGADVRYSLMTYPALAVLGGLGLSRLVRIVARFAPRLPARALALTAVVFQFLWYVPVVRATTEEAWAARADVRSARSFVADLPGNWYVLAHNPGMFHLWGISAGQMSQVAANPDYLDFLAHRYTGGIYVHWNFWCNVQDPVQREFCRKAIALGPTEIVREYRERDQYFALYRLKRPPS